jgi:hypothetical protein
MIRDLQNRLQRAIDSLDVGVGVATFKRHPLLATNKALRMLGAPQIKDINSRLEVLRAVIYIEGQES